MKLQLLDCTLRDGANIVGTGFDRSTTLAILEGLCDASIPIIEFGHSKGIGGSRVSGKMVPLSDKEYIKIAEPFMRKASVGMFCQPGIATEELLEMVAENGLGFIRIGCNGNEVDDAYKLIHKAISLGIDVRFSMKKAYILTPTELIEKALRIQDEGIKSVTIMDSAGTMTPDQVSQYISTMVAALDIPVGFHGHNNLGLSVGNSLVAAKSGASILDTCLMGMGRSAGNTPTEILTAILIREGFLIGVDPKKIISFIETKLQSLVPFHQAPVLPKDIILGYAGCHSNLLNSFEDIAQEECVEIYDLIVATSASSRNNPNKELIREVAKSLRKKCYI